MTSQKNYNYLIDLIGGVWIENNGTQHLKIKDKPYYDMLREKRQNDTRLIEIYGKENL